MADQCCLVMFQTNEFWISISTPLNVFLGTSYYSDSTHPCWQYRQMTACTEVLQFCNCVHSFKDVKGENISILFYSISLVSVQILHCALFSFKALDKHDINETRVSFSFDSQMSRAAHCIVIFSILFLPKRHLSILFLQYHVCLFVLFIYLFILI